MTQLDLRPLSLGEILDRSFLIYRRHFLLFAGIIAIPLTLRLAFGLLQIAFLRLPAVNDMPGGIGFSVFDPTHILIGLAGAIVAVVVYALAQGGTIAAVSEIYLGRTTSISASLQRAWSEIGTLIGTSILSGLVTLLCFVALIVPGIYVLCRLIVALPAALIENRGPRESLSRSWNLTSGFAGRSFLLLLIYFVLTAGLGLLVGIPVGLFVVVQRGAAPVPLFLAANEIASVLVSVLVTPLLLIGTSIYYFDLRVRKEAFDLQFMIDPESEHITRADSGTSIL